MKKNTMLLTLLALAVSIQPVFASEEVALLQEKFKEMADPNAEIKRTLTTHYDYMQKQKAGRLLHRTVVDYNKMLAKGEEPDSKLAAQAFYHLRFGDPKKDLKQLQWLMQKATNTSKLPHKDCHKSCNKTVHISEIPPLEFTS